MKVKMTILALLVSCVLQAQNGPEILIPKPSSYSLTEGTYTLPENPTFSVSGISDKTALAELRDVACALPLNLVPGSKPSVRIKVDSRKFDSAEAYSFSVTPRGINICAASDAAAFYALQDLLQLTEDGTVKQIRCFTMQNSPRFGYRGLHFDVSRHFRSKEFIMKQIDAMSRFHLNRLHFHLTDGAGWRIEIKSYPRLTGYAAWRTHAKWKEWAPYNTYCEEGTAGAYGGYYTHEDIREIVEYARLKHITVIPEIEMPSHSEEVMAAYPEMSCKGTTEYQRDLCIGKEATFEFIEKVLDEVLELFPSEYIHIGGDEADKVGWAECPDCKRRMEEEGLESLNELQSYMIQRVEKYLNSKGRRIIGWDEILEGGLAPDATVMSWRGLEGGLEAAAKGHDVIMTPSNYCYLDRAQDAHFKEPEGIGGYLTLRTLYEYDPALGFPAEDEKYILGVQGNLWSEYVPTDEHCEYMYYPRACGVAELGWSSRDGKDFEEFRARAKKAMVRLRALGYTTFDMDNEIRESMDEPVVTPHLGLGAKVTYGTPWHSAYPGDGEGTLTDGLQGSWNYASTRWQGFLSDFDVTVDLGEVKDIHYVGTCFVNETQDWIHLPKDVTVSVSEDGVNFTTVATKVNTIPTYCETKFAQSYPFVISTAARFIRVQATRADRPGSWLFIDEIFVN